LGERRLAIALGLIASVPIVVAAVHAVVVGWVPDGDRAYFAVRAFDVLSGRTPLLGPWSSGATAAVGRTVYSPGPLLYWLLAIPARYLPESLLQVTIGVVNVACVIGACVLARRRGGLPLLLATAIAIPVMTASLPASTHSDLWNTSAPLFPLVLLVFTCWSLACGDYRLLPLAVLVASFAVETHLTFAAPVAGLLLVGVVGLALSHPFRRASGVGRWIVAAVLVAVVCWTPPIIDQLTHSPGNLRLLVDASTSSEPTLGLHDGWHALVHMVGVVPWWLSDPPTGIERITDVVGSPGAVAVASTLLVLAAVAAALVLGWRRRRADVWAASALALVLCASIAADAASTPKQAFETLDYTLRWGSPAGMCVWLLLGWSVLTLAGPVRRRAPAGAVALAGVAATAVVTVIVAVSVTPSHDSYDTLRAVSSRLKADLPHAGTTLVDGASFDKAGAIYSLRRAGRDVVTPGAGRVLSSEYEPGPSYARRVRIDLAPPGQLPPASPGRTLTRLRDRAPDGTPRSVAVVLLPGR
jgi:hypothetical protein